MSIPLPPHGDERLAMEHIIACFHFLLQQPGAQVQKYTCAELSEAIKNTHSLDNQKVAWTVALLEERADTFLTVTNY